jgi:hypothetical protein
MNKFIDYVDYTHDLHPKINDLSFPSIQNFQHLILYGPQGVGKYTKMISIVKRYSPSHLKCDRRLQIDTTSVFYIKISDIHYEIDMDMLGCNSKPLWNDIHTHINEIIQSKFPEKHGIIVCKNFHKINHELLDIFYSYMQSNIKYIFLTEAVSFLPVNILSKCKLLPLARPSIETYQTCLNVPIPPIVYNIKTVLQQRTDINPIKTICAKLLKSIRTLEFTMAELREDLYTILIFDMGVEKIIWNLLTTLEVNASQRLKMIKETVQFLQYFNNNYRPIYHLEKYIYALITIVHLK